MPIALISAIFLFAMFLTSCGASEKESIEEFTYGAFKVDVRSEEFHASGIKNIDICLANIDSKAFPESRTQCVLSGYDVSGLSINWVSQREVEISFVCGRVMRFTNYATVIPPSSNPIEFHILLKDGCIKERRDRVE